MIAHNTVNLLCSVQTQSDFIYGDARRYINFDISKILSFKFSFHQFIDVVKGSMTGSTNRNRQIICIGIEFPRQQMMIMNTFLLSTKHTSSNCFHFFFLASLTVFRWRGLFQYGDLHAEQFLGTTDSPSSSSRGHHLCLQRIHSNCSTSTFLPNSIFISYFIIYYLVYILSVVNNIYCRVYCICMNTKIQTQWYNNLENLTNLVRFIIDKDGEIDTVYFLEKPWKWDQEWMNYQKSCHQSEMDEGLDAFDRRDK